MLERLDVMVSGGYSKRLREHHGTSLTLSVLAYIRLITWSSKFSCHVGQEATLHLRPQGDECSNRARADAGECRYLPCSLKRVTDACGS